jgi:TPR repeat protein
MNDDDPPSWKWFYTRLPFILLTLLAMGLARGYFHKEKNYKVEPTSEMRAYAQDEINRMYQQRDNELRIRLPNAIDQGLEDTKATQTAPESAIQSSEAELPLDEIHAMGNGATQDYAEEVKSLRKAADLGNADAQFKLAVILANGPAGVTQDIKEALRLLRLASEQGMADAQHRLGIAYYAGIGGLVDYSEAAKWLLRAAEQNIPDAQFQIAMMYGVGQGVPRNEQEAMKWCRRASGQGVTKAQMILGQSYANGQGVPLDEIEAHAWFSIAAESSETDAAKYRDILGRKFSPEKLSRAEKRRSLILDEISESKSHRSKYYIESAPIR